MPEKKLPRRKKTVVIDDATFTFAEPSFGEIRAYAQARRDAAGDSREDVLKRSAAAEKLVVDCLKLADPELDLTAENIYDQMGMETFNLLFGALLEAYGLISKDETPNPTPASS